MLNDFANTNQNVDNNRRQDDEGIKLGEIFVILLENKWLIIFVTLIALIIGVARSFLATPIYKADAMIQVKENSQPLGALEPMAGLFETKVPIQAEMQIIKSRMVLGEAAKNLNMEIIAQPKYFPWVGEAIARQYQLRHSGIISEPIMDYADYAWGGEVIKVDTFILPESWVGKNLILIAGQKGKFTVSDNNQFFTEGTVGAVVDKMLPGETVSFKLFVSQLKARVGTHFILKKQKNLVAIRQLQTRFSVAEKGRGTGILSFSMESTSPLLAKKTLNEIANIYVRLNVEQKSAEAQKTLEFLEQQVPKIKDQLESATTVLNTYRLKKGSIDLNIETQSILSGVVEIRTKITILQQKRDELRQSFTPSHPTIIAIDKQIDRLKYQMKRHNRKITELPETQQVILRLTRDVQVNTELYTTLLNNLQTIRVAKAGTVGDVRVIDYAITPEFPIKPKKKLIVLVALILGLVLGVVLAFIRKAINHGIEDPEIIENHLNIPVYATVPHSESQLKLNNQLKKTKAPKGIVTVLAKDNNEDLAIESLRSLRTTLHFAFIEAKNNVIMITGPSPGVGKTFISTNLAFVLATAGKKILLIDGDMRKGFINKTLGVSRENGLSDLISNTITPEQAIHTIEEGGIDFISTGSIPPNPSELLLHERFSQLLDSLGTKYDHIIIDSPPILAVTDACIIGRMASATLMVVKAGRHPLRELQQSVKRLKQNKVELKGVVFNDVSTASSRYGYGYGYGYGKYIYQYNYQQK